MKTLMVILIFALFGQVAESQNIVPAKMLFGHKYTVLCLDVDSTGKYLVSGSYDTDVILWNSKSGEQLSKFNGHSAGVWSVKVSPDNKYIASGSWDNNRNAVGSSQNCLNILDMKTLKGLNTLSIFPDSYIARGLFPELDAVSSNGIYSISFSPDGSKVAAITRRGDLFIWDILNKFSRSVYAFSESKHRLLSLSPDWKYVVCSEEKRTLIDTSFYLMRLGSDEVVANFSTPRRSVIEVCFSSNSKYIASISGDRILRNEIDIWDIQSQKLIYTMIGHTNVVRSIAFSKDDNYLASAGEDNIINLWNIKTGQLIVSFSENNDKELTSVIFSADHKYLISGSQDKTIKYWSIDKFM